MPRSENMTYVTYHLLILQLLGNIPRTAPGDFDPGLGDDRARACDERNVDQRVDGIK